jgi:NADPH2:quinone reductase
MTFRGLRIFSEDGGTTTRLVELSIDELSAGSVVIRCAYSSVNYKDALAATGTGKVVRRFPLVGGIDLAGVVESSDDDRFARGDLVLATGYELGVSHDGGYAGFARVPADWVVKLPAGLSLAESMAIGTAGFTAGLSIVEMERNGLAPASGEVIVTGATGGVGCMAVQSLAAAGYRVTALTGKPEATDFLQSLGAATIVNRHTLEMGTRPLEKATWAGAVDAVGGDALAWLTRTMNYGGTIASTGLTAGAELRTTVMPFILRGVKLLGIDSAMCPMPTRTEVWRRLGSDLKPAHLDLASTEIGLEDLPRAFETLLHGRARGRFLVRLP